MNLEKLLVLSKHIESYQPSPPADELARKLGIEKEKIIKLNSNENLFLENIFMKDILQKALDRTDPRLYPQSEEDLLKNKIAELNKIDPSQIVICSGGDHAIELLFSLPQIGNFTTAVTPTFSIYPRVALQRCINLKEARLNPDFSLNINRVLEFAYDSSLIIVCNPNNPTGNQFPKEKLLQLIERIEGLVLIDEAYQEYADYSLIELVSSYENLVILRTFSKAYGLAGLRLGYLVTNDDLARIIRDKFMMPYPVSNLVINSGIEVLDNLSVIMDAIEKTKYARDWLINKLNEINGVHAYPSNTNFVLFSTKKSYIEIYEELLQEGIIVSKQGRLLEVDNCLRVTVAPREIMVRFLKKLEEIMNE